MFLKGIKRKLAQKYISKHSTANREIDQRKIHTLGILVDATVFKNFPYTNELTTLFNIPESAMSFLYYQPNTKLVKEMDALVFTDNALAFNGQLKGKEVLDFVNQSFDALLNFHDDQQLLLKLASVHSKAKFKIGFSGVGTNDFNINTSLTDIKTITFELKKYLAILNKI